MIGDWKNVFSESEKRQKKKMLVDYLYTNLKNHNFWAYKYFFCEFLGLLNISGKIMSKSIKNLTFVFRANVSYGQILWWYLFHIWYWSFIFCRKGSGGQDRSNGLVLLFLVLIMQYFFFRFTFFLEWLNVHFTSLVQVEK